MPFGVGRENSNLPRPSCLACRAEVKEKKNLLLQFRTKYKREYENFYNLLFLLCFFGGLAFVSGSRRVASPSAKLFGGLFGVCVFVALTCLHFGPTIRSEMGKKIEIFGAISHVAEKKDMCTIVAEGMGRRAEGARVTASIVVCDRRRDRKMPNACLHEIV